MYFILLVLHNPDRLSEVLAAWNKAGISGATILESFGLFQMSQEGFLPMRYQLTPPKSSEERSNYTLFSIVEDAALIQTALHAAEAVIGDLNQPKSGIFAAWPLMTVKGVTGRGDAGQRQP